MSESISMGFANDLACNGSNFSPIKAEGDLEFKPGSHLADIDLDKEVEKLVLDQLATLNKQ